MKRFFVILIAVLTVGVATGRYLYANTNDTSATKGDDVMCRFTAGVEPSNVVPYNNKVVCTLENTNNYSVNVFLYVKQKNDLVSSDTPTPIVLKAKEKRSSISVSHWAGNTDNLSLSMDVLKCD